MKLTNKELQELNTGRSFPVTDICGCKFFVDAVNQVFMDTQNPVNMIGMHEMIVFDDHIEGLFDTKKRNLKPDDWSAAEGGQYQYFWLRRPEVLDPEGAKLLIAAGDYNFQDMPVVDIAGEPFYWNDRSSELCQVANPFNRIFKNDMIYSVYGEYGKQSGTYFDTIKKWVPFPHELNPVWLKGGMPGHIKFITVSEIVEKINKAKGLTEAKKQKTARGTAPSPKRKGRGL